MFLCLSPWTNKFQSKASANGSCCLPNIKHDILRMNKAGMLSYVGCGHRGHQVVPEESKHSSGQ